MARYETVLGVEVDEEIKKRAHAVMKANGMTIGGAVRRMAPYPLRSNKGPGV